MSLASVHEFMKLKQIILKIYYNFNRIEINKMFDIVKNSEERIEVYEMARFHLLLLLKYKEDKTKEIDEISIEKFGLKFNDLIEKIIYWWNILKKSKANIENKNLQTNFDIGRLKETLKQLLSLEVENPNKLLRKFQMLDNECSKYHKHCIIGYPNDNEDLEELAQEQAQMEELPWFEYDYTIFKNKIGDFPRSNQNDVLRINCDGAIFEILDKSGAITKKSTPKLMKQCGIKNAWFKKLVDCGPNKCTPEQYKWFMEYQKIHLIPQVKDSTKFPAKEVIVDPGFIPGVAKNILLPSVMLGPRKKTEGGKKSKKCVKSCRKHKGITQSGGNKGKLRKGYKYTGKRLKSGLSEIKKVKK